MNEKLPSLGSNGFVRLNRFRNNIRFSLTGMLVFALFWVNIAADSYPRLRDINLLLVLAVVYSALYHLFISRFLKNTASVYLGALSLFAVVAFLVYFTGGNESVFVGYFYLFILAVGLSLGILPLVTMTVIVEVILYFYLTASDGITVSFIRNSILAAVSFVVSFLITKEYSTQGREYAQIEAMAEQQKILNKEKDDLISIVSHEFRTPVSAIKGYVDLLARQFKDVLAQEQREFLQKIDVNISKLQAIMENTLNISVLESGAMTLFFQPVDLEKLVTETLSSTLKIEAEEKGIYLTLNLPKTRLPLISADPQRLRQIITNLVDNAIKYTEKGGVTVNLDRSDGQVVVSVSDTGKGIKKEDFPHLFQKFFRAGDYKTRTTQGSGLGLYITKLLIERHRGTIEVSSEEGRGTTFVIKLPIPQEDETWSQQP